MIWMVPTSISETVLFSASSLVPPSNEMYRLQEWKLRWIVPQHSKNFHHVWLKKFSLSTPSSDIKDVFMNKTKEGEEG